MGLKLEDTQKQTKVYCCGKAGNKIVNIHQKRKLTGKKGRHENTDECLFFVIKLATTLSVHVDFEHPIEHLPFLNLPLICM